MHINPGPDYYKSIIQLKEYTKTINHLVESINEMSR